MNFTTSIFLNSLKDLVAEIPGTYDNKNALIKTNIGEALLYGFEYSLYLKVLNQFNIYNTFSYVRGLENKNDQDLPQIVPLNSILGIEFFPFDWLNADISAAIFAEQNKIAPGEISTPGYLTLNFKINFIDINLGKLRPLLFLGLKILLIKNIETISQLIEVLLLVSQAEIFLYVQILNFS